MHNSNNSALSKDRIFGASNHTDINSILNNAAVLEEISVAKAKEALISKLITVKEPAQITETPKFHEAKAESVELSQSAKETFTRIGERATTKSLNEQIEEARKHFKQTFAKQQTKRDIKRNEDRYKEHVASNPTARLIDEALKSLVNNKAHSKPNNSREVAV
ncbi:MAG: hypothetical protein EBY20_04355 [Alphaproteobacteria bacterium]|nr:hypothetical protein [Alphaproteobacteria bacterium]